MYNRILYLFLIASLFFSGNQVFAAEETDVKVLSECARAVGTDPSLVRKTNVLPSTPCTDEAYGVTVSIMDGRLGYTQHVRFPAGLAHQRVRTTIDAVDVMESMRVCQTVSPDGSFVNEWFVQKGANCAGRESGSSLYRRYLREKHPDTGKEEVRVCLVLSQTKSDCRPLTWFEPEAQRRVRTSLARADTKLARLKEERSRLARLSN